MNRIKKTILFLVFASVITSCSNMSELVFENECLKFKLPNGWILKEEQNPAGNTDVIIFQNGKFIPKGLLTVTIFDGTKDALNLIELYKKHLGLKKLGINIAKSTFGTPISDQLGLHNTLACSYILQVPTANTKGVIHVLHNANKTIVFLIQELNGNSKIYDNSILELEGSLELLSKN